MNMKSQRKLNVVRSKKESRRDAQQRHTADRKKYAPADAQRYVCNKEVMNLMEANIPEEIQEKLKIIEKEAVFSQKMWPPNKWQWWYVLLGGACLLMLSIVSAAEGDYFETLFSVTLAILIITNHFEYKKLYKLHSNARDIINYYRNREVKNKT